MVNNSHFLYVFLICIISAILDCVLYDDALKHNGDDDLNQTWIQLMQDLKVWEEIDDHMMILRRRWVQGSAEWLAGKYESKENDKLVLGYSDYEWEFVWTTMVQDGALKILKAEY